MILIVCRYLLIKCNILITMIINVFGEVVRDLREKRKLTQENLAEISGFHRTYIGMIERGERNPSLKNIYKIAKSLDVSLTEIFSECEKKLN